MASARSLYKFLLVVLIHAREAGTEVIASCADNDEEVTMMSCVVPLMFSQTTNQKPKQQQPTKTNHKQTKANSNKTKNTKEKKQSVESKRHHLRTAVKSGVKLAACVPYTEQAIHWNQQRNNKTSPGWAVGCQSKKVTVPKPGIPPARIPEIAL